MAGSHRFHLDQDGHSITVLLGHVAQDIEVLVDGKVVAVRRGHRGGVRELAAELPGDPPRPFTILVEDLDGAPLCVMVRDGSRFLMPQVPLVPGAPGHERPAPGRPWRRLRRRLRRWLRRVAGRG
ncbi:hypothetical protein [Streptomyces sp. NPDC006368]|uniref:hypothetical protein n=1 Tax=Streptomyces sp. NPDC006368 TaxID=3156760 RepID=UPI0033B10443